MTEKNLLYDGSYPLLPASSTLYIGQSNISAFTPFCGQMTDIVLITNSYTEASYEFYLRHGTTGICSFKENNIRSSLATLLLFYEFNENSGQRVIDYQSTHTGTLGISQNNFINDPQWNTVFNIFM